MRVIGQNRRKRDVTSSLATAIASTDTAHSTQTFTHPHIRVRVSNPHNYAGTLVHEHNAPVTVIFSVLRVRRTTIMQTTASTQNRPR